MNNVKRHYAKMHNAKKVIVVNRDSCSVSGASGCKNKAAFSHPCPFNSEINNDGTECECCEMCEAGCADEI